jgi:hypothetical protein
MAKVKAKKTVRKAGRKPADVLRQTWSATLEALGSAERKVEKQIRLLLKNNTISGKEAQALLKGFASRLARSATACSARWRPSTSPAAARSPS